MTASHMNEETLAMFAEGTLAAEEARKVAEHIAACNLCLSGVRAANEHFREEASAPHGARWWMAIAAIVAVAIAGAIWIRERSSSPIAQLVALSPKDARPVEPRLTGGFAWAPYRGPVRTRDAAPDAQQMKLAGAAGELIEDAARERTSDVQHAAAVGIVLTADPQDAATRLRALTARSPKNAALWSDLAAAETAAALRFGRPSLYPDALAAADRALELDPQMREASFNRALILERMGLAAEARTAWQRYLGIDPGSQWANEARRRLARLGNASQASKPGRAFAEGETLARWGEAELRQDAAQAKQQLDSAREIGRAISERSGEALLRDAVNAIDRADASTCVALANAHLVYRRGRIHYSQQRPAEAEADLREAARAFERGGSPMALVARYYAANTHFDQNDVAGARAELQSLLREAVVHPQYVALRGGVQWELALCDAVDGDWNASLAAATSAADSFHRLGEPANEAFVETLAAQALCALGRPDEEWAARIRSFTALADDASDRPSVSLNSAARSELRSGRHDAGLAMLRVFAESARTSRNDGLLADALLQQTLLHAEQMDDRRAAEAALAEMPSVVARVGDPRLREKAENDLRFARAAVLLDAQPAAAEELLTSVITFQQQSGKPALLPELYLLRARARLRSGEMGAASADLESGMSAVETQRVALARGIGGGSLDAGRALYREAIALSLGHGDTRAAFAYAERSRGERKPDLDTLQRRLAGARTAVVELTSTARDVIALVVTADRIDALHTTPDAPLPPVANVDQIIVVPDRTLAQIPFAALRDDRGRLLIERYAISTATSATSLQSSDESVPRSAVAMLLPSGDGSGTLALPESAGELSDVCASYVSCESEQPATFAALQAAARHADVLHLAGHTQTSGGETALVFGAERISWRTIAATPLRHGSVVVLAACETLRSPIASDDRAPSLGEAFVAAGAADVVGTLTPITDADARSLFRDVHRELAAGRSAAEAVRRAQLDAIARGDRAAWQSIAVLTRRIPTRPTERRIAWAH